MKFNQKIGWVIFVLVLVAGGTTWWLLEGRLTPRERIESTLDSWIIAVNPNVEFEVEHPQDWERLPGSNRLNDVVMTLHSPDMQGAYATFKVSENLNNITALEYLQRISNSQKNLYGMEVPVSEMDIDGQHAYTLILPKSDTNPYQIFIMAMLDHRGRLFEMRGYLTDGAGEESEEYIIFEHIARSITFIEDEQ